MSIEEVSIAEITFGWPANLARLRVLTEKFKTDVVSAEEKLELDRLNCLLELRNRFFANVGDTPWGDWS